MDDGGVLEVHRGSDLGERLMEEIERGGGSVLPVWGLSGLMGPMPDSLLRMMGLRDGVSGVAAAVHIWSMRSDIGTPVGRGEIDAVWSEY